MTAAPSTSLIFIFATLLLCCCCYSTVSTALSQSHHDHQVTPVSTLLEPYPEESQLGQNPAPPVNHASLYRLFPLAPPTKHLNYTYEAIQKSPHQPFTGNFFTMQDARHFHVYPSRHGCPGRESAKKNMMQRKCEFAMNAGFFNVRTGGCLGQVVSDGHVVQFDKGRTANANFGITKDHQYIIGYLNPEDWKKFEFQQLVTGVLWLVKDGEIFVNESIAREHPSWTFCEEAAPRVSVGHDKHGRLLMLQLDGMEFRDEGPNVWEMAKMMKQLGAVNAINLDGGGSASSILAKGGESPRILSECCDYCPIGPIVENSCPATPDRCLRNVTTIICGKL